MRRLLSCLALLVTLLAVGNVVLEACGSKFLVSSRGARLLRGAGVVPTKILIYWKEDANTPEEDRWNPEATKFLEAQGHTVELATQSDSFLASAAKGDFEVALMPVADARELASALHEAAPHIGLLPVLYLPTRKERRQAKEEFGHILRYPVGEEKVLEAIEQTRRSARKSAAQAAL